MPVGGSLMRMALSIASLALFVSGCAEGHSFKITNPCPSAVDAFIFESTDAAARLYTQVRLEPGKNEVGGLLVAGQFRIEYSLGSGERVITTPKLSDKEATVPRSVCG